MSAFIASPPSAAPGADVPAAGTVAGDGWFPDVAIADFRDEMRIDSNAVDARVRGALRGAMLTVRGELRAWRAAHLAAGVASLAAVAPDDTLDGEPVAVLTWRRAIFSHAAADLAESHNDIAATREGKERSEGEALTAADHRRNATHAIRDLLGVGRTDVELV